jgi:hypothetical protein
MIAGLSVLIGWGWALFIFDLLSHSFSGDYREYQISYPGSKSVKGKFFGILLMVSGGIIFLISLLNY